MRQFYQVVIALFLISSAGAQTVKVDESGSSVKLRGKIYEVRLAAKSPAANSGTATLEIIAPDDRVLASATTPVQLRAGTNRISGTVTLSQLPARQEELLWYRLRYSINLSTQAPIQGILPLLGTAADFNLLVSAPYQAAAGQKILVHARTKHPVLEHAAAGVTVKATLEDDDTGAPLASASGTTDRDGFVQLAIAVPQKDTRHKLNLRVEARRGTAVRTTEAEIKVGTATRIFLQTDKPLYQPGQILHIRSVIFGDQNRALPGKKIYLQVEDEDDTVVFREERTTSRFGVAAADWTIPDRIKFGSYRVAAKTFPGTYSDDDDDPDALSASSDRKVVRISRYDLPNFVVTVNPDKGYYLPGQKPRVTVNAAYLFGKPVSKARVRVARLEERQWDFLKQKWDVNEGEAVESVTDEKGNCTVELDLAAAQESLADSRRSRFRDVTYTAYVTDAGSARTEERRFDLRATRDAIHVYFLAPGYTHRGLPDEFYVSTSYADGSAAQAEVEVRTSAPDGSGERLLTIVRTNRYGVARVRGAGKGVSQQEHDVPLILIAHDSKGARGLTSETLGASPEQVIWLETPKTIFAPGESIEAEVHSNFDGEVLFEISNREKVLQSSTIRLHNHHAYMKIPYSDDFKGVVTLAVGNMAGRYTNSAESGRSVFFPENRKLDVNIKLDHGEYRPGQPGVATVQLRNADGARIPGVFGAVIFDKAVEERARIDEDLKERFGFGYYGYWWYQDSAKLSGLSMADLDAVDTSKAVPEELDMAADFLLNATGYPGGSWTGRMSDDSVTDSAHEIYREQIGVTLQPVLAIIERERNASGVLPRNRGELDALLKAHKLAWADFKDPWGSEFIPSFALNDFSQELEIRSAGPDKKAATDDDFRVAGNYASIYEPTRREVRRAITLYREKTGEFVRDSGTLKRALAEARVNPALLLDPWGHPYEFDFGIDGSTYTVVGKSHGKLGQRQPSYAVGTSAIDYFADARRTIQNKLNSKVQVLRKIPESADQFKAMLLPEVNFDDLRDPYGRPYLLRMLELARYGDRRLQTNQQVSSEPVTIWTRGFKVRSAGPDGIPDTADDFDVAAFSALLAETTVEGKTYPAKVSALFSGEAGGVSGTVTDPQGAVIQGAQVKATNVATGAQYQAQTDSVGAYLFSLLPSGMYTIEVSATGFTSSVLHEVLVLAQQMTYANAKLYVGSTSMTVEVAAENVLVQTQTMSASVSSKSSFIGTLKEQATVTPRLRQYFPETLLWQPSIETGRDGQARIAWNFADNLTTWKMSLIASTLDGRMATVEKEVKTFQPFFVEHDPPKSLTVGDRIWLPVIVRNYTAHPEKVNVELAGTEWFRTSGNEQQTASIEPGDNMKLVFPFQATSATAAGKQRVTATSGKVADAIERSVAVHPDGAELSRTDGGIISGETQLEFQIPGETIPGSVHADLKIYPDLVSQVTEALEGIMARPWGCGEQTISSTYPSLLLLQFEKRSKRSLGPLHERAMRYLQMGYMRLLGYADAGGGITYWGRGEPDIALTAYAVRFLHDASEFTTIDASLLETNRQWLLKQQKPDGSWQGHRWYGESAGRDAILTAYVLRMVALTKTAETKQKDGAAEQAAVGRALDFLSGAAKSSSDPYLWATYGLAAAATGQGSRVAEVLPQLRQHVLTERGAAYWDLQSNTAFYVWGHAGRVETTALAVELLEMAGNDEDKHLADRGLEFLIHEKDRYGAWYTTQTTVNVTEALLLLAAREKESAGPLQVKVNGSPVQVKDGSSLTVQVLDVSSLVRQGSNTVLVSGGNGVSSAQVVENYYVPWTSGSATSGQGPLKLDVNCDHLQAEIGANVTCQVKAERIGSAGYGMMIAEIGVPPGVEVDREALQKQTSESGWELSYFEVLPDRVVTYLWPRAGGTKFFVRFKGRMAIDAKAAPHRLWDYYNPDAVVTMEPGRFVIRDGGERERAQVAER